MGIYVIKESILSLQRVNIIPLEQLFKLIPVCPLLRLTFHFSLTDLSSINVKWKNILYFYPKFYLLTKSGDLGYPQLVEAKELWSSCVHTHNKVFCLFCNSKDIKANT